MVNAKYTPILKWKAAEMGALRDLTDTQKDAVLPVFEFVRPLTISDKDRKSGIRSPEEKLREVLPRTVPEDILKNWGDGRLFFADFTLIFPESLRKAFADKFCKNSRELYLKFVPVINLSADSDNYQESITEFVRSHSLAGLCVRLSSVDIQDVERTNFLLRRILSKNSLDYSSISVLVDLKEETGNEMYDMAFENIQKIESITEYANVILAGGAFPKDMSKYERSKDDNYQKRDDWLGWSSRVGKYPVTPIFADYTIRHPIYDEVVMKYQSTATIKYAVADRWNIYKGAQGEFDNYLAYASLLRETADFYGADFSAGDSFIDDKGKYFSEYMEKVNKGDGKKIGGTGNTEQWLCAGINHHMAVVVDQISN